MARRESDGIANDISSVITDDVDIAAKKVAVTLRIVVLVTNQPASFQPGDPTRNGLTAFTRI